MMTVRKIAPQGRRRALVTIACLLTSFSGLEAASAETWPSKTVTAIAPFAAGSAADVMARIALDQISKQVGRPIVVENRVGAGGTLGANVVAKAAPDGYTILAHSSSLAAAHGLYPALPYDTLRDLAPVIPLGLQPMVLVTAPAKGWKTLGDLVTAAKAKAGALNFASAGVGSASHIAVERLRVSAGFDGAAHPVQGRDGGVYGSHGRARGHLVFPARAGACAHQGWQARPARGQHVEADRRPGPGADHERSRSRRLGL